jgi:hypothetical protein
VGEWTISPAIANLRKMLLVNAIERQELRGNEQPSRIQRGECLDETDPRRK